ncbi:PP2C family serine/threonine-protein phosphatase [Thermoactinospora rubra]|uniref:PP2C family serine/threonine-protein phosphatase n=1 Tax=Thermoactinospora rubra TaxID=1088767 RepID=UPI000A1004A1|nr:protein phosphatase 2C domain-containing protein [Thermoactinospora rubra]
MTCASCQAPVLPEHTFCENCGHRLADPSACPACGSADVDEERYCLRCGLRVPAGRDHHEIELEGGAAGVTDKGLRRHRNEDAMALLAGEKVTIGVVCDGVATSPRGDEAAVSAAGLAARTLLEELSGGAAHHDATVRAARAAARLVAGMGTPEDAPACTYVSAIVTPGEITVGWIGDSRAYWLPDGGPPVRLTEDDVAVKGVLSSWLGADAEPVDPHVHTFAPDSPGLLLACSDGLWEYLAEGFPDAAGTPLERARTLLGHALDRGGRDNVTIVLIPGGPDR